MVGPTSVEARRGDLSRVALTAELCDDLDVFEQDAIERCLEQHDPKHILEVLTPYVTEARQARIEDVVTARLTGIQIAIEAPSDPHNAAAVVRTAEALGVLAVHVVAAEGRALHAKRTTQGAFHWVNTYHHRTLDGFLEQVRPTYRLCGAWMDAPTLVDDLPVDEPICVLFGNESRGLSSAAKSACTCGFRISMVGMSESLNLSVSAAITLYELTRRRRALKGQTDLSLEDEMQLRARYYLGSVDQRLYTALLKPS